MVGIIESKIRVAHDDLESFLKQHDGAFAESAELEAANTQLEASKY